MPCFRQILCTPPNVRSRLRFQPANQWMPSPPALKYVLSHTRSNPVRKPFPRSIPAKEIHSCCIPICSPVQIPARAFHTGLRSPAASSIPIGVCQTQAQKNLLFPPCESATDELSLSSPHFCSDNPSDISPAGPSA